MALAPRKTSYIAQKTKVPLPISKIEKNRLHCNESVTFSRPTKPTRSQKIDWIEINLYTVLVVVHHSEVSTSARIEELDYSKLIHSHELA